MSKVVVITGGSSGIGLYAAKELARRGHIVYELSRRDSNVQGINHIKADVSDEFQVDNAFDEIINQQGKIDALINCAGFGISGAVEFTPTAQAKKLLDVNLFGTVNTMNSVLKFMRKQGYGRIINISSVAAVVSIPFQAYYSLSKSAINSLSFAVANEVAPFGVQVCAVMPGDIKTGFSKARLKSHDGDDIYNGRINRSVDRMEKDEQGGMSPEIAAVAIRKIVEKKKVKPLYAIGFWYKIVVVLSRVLPTGFTNRMLGMLYAK